MRSLKILAFILIFGILFSSSLGAAELAPPGTRTRKLQRGLLNTAFAPVEFSRSLEEVKKEDSIIPTWLTGGTVGLIWMTVRLVTGLYEIVTFPISSPKNYEPVYEPEFALEHLGLLKDEA